MKRAKSVYKEPVKFGEKAMFASVQDKGRPRLLVLVADPDPQVREMVSEILQRESCEILHLESSDELQQVLAKSPPFDVVLINISEPAEECLDLIFVVKASCPITEVIFVSGLGDEALWIEAIQRGAYDFLPKPVNKNELRRIVDNILERNRAISQLKMGET